MPPAVSVIVPARDAASSIAATVTAIGDQVLDGGVELIVVDNGSRDDTAALARDAGAVVLTRPRGEGPGRARNAGAEAARGRALAFVDSDCQPAPGWLAAGVRALKRADLVQGRVEPDPRTPAGPYDRSVRVDRMTGLFESANLFIDRRALLALGGFPPGLERAGDAPFGEDTLLGWRARRRGLRIAFCAEALVHHAVVPRGPRGFIAERLRLRWFPALAAEVPELRREVLFAGAFLTPRLAALHLALAGGALARSSKTRVLLVASIPYGVGVARSAGAWGSRRAPEVAATLVIADLLAAAALAAGSIAARSVVL